MKKEQAKYWLTKGTENKSREKGPGDLVQKKRLRQIRCRKKGRNGAVKTYNFI